MPVEIVSRVVPGRVTSHDETFVDQLKTRNHVVTSLTDHIRSGYQNVLVICGFHSKNSEPTFGLALRSAIASIDRTKVIVLTQFHRVEEWCLHNRLNTLQ